jgi:hypothetical protein
LQVSMPDLQAVFNKPSVNSPVSVSSSQGPLIPIPPLTVNLQYAFCALLVGMLIIEVSVMAMSSLVIIVYGC